MTMFPIFFITGASGTGKTTIIPELYKMCSEHIVLDMDSLFYALAGNWKTIKNVWIYVANELALNSKITILSGIFIPEDFKEADFKNNFKPYFIGLYCTNYQIERRLYERKWSKELIDYNKTLNKWFIDNAKSDFDPPMSLIDTSNLSPYNTALKVKELIDKILCESKI